MSSLNDLCIKYCKPKCESFTQVSKDITLIDNFFEDFEEAKKFFKSREKWDCLPFQGHDLPGYLSIFPKWIGKYVMSEYISKNEKTDEIKVESTVCNFRHNEQKCWSAVSSDFFPHVDGVEEGESLNHICLVNLNDVPVHTNFYTYKNEEYCRKKIYDEWNYYCKKINDQVLNHYKKYDITRNEVKSFLDDKKLETKLIRKVEYKPNQAIIYPVDLFHSPSVSLEFSKNNLRSMLRITFIRKKLSQLNNIDYT